MGTRKAAPPRDGPFGFAQGRRRPPLQLHRRPVRRLPRTLAPGALAEFAGGDALHAAQEAREVKRILEAAAVGDRVLVLTRGPGRVREIVDVKSAGANAVTYLHQLLDEGAAA